MYFQDSTLREIPETSYLNTENTWRYRAIMRTFYLEAQKANVRLNRDQLLQLLHGDPRFAAYGLDQLEQDLQLLCRWRNLVPIQDARRPTSIAEYKNKQFSYSLSPVATEIERITLVLEQLDLRTAVLPSHLFERILDDIDKFPHFHKPTPEPSTLGGMLFNRIFGGLSNRYQDYLRIFISTHAEHILKTAEFLPYKDKVVQYLRDFVLELQRHSEKIRRMLLAIPSQTISLLLDRVYSAALSEGAGVLVERRDGIPSTAARANPRLLAQLLPLVCAGQRRAQRQSACNRTGQ